MESQPQNPDFRNNLETFTHESMILSVAISLCIFIFSNNKSTCLATDR